MHLTFQLQIATFTLLLLLTRLLPATLLPAALLHVTLLALAVLVLITHGCFPFIGVTNRVQTAADFLRSRLR